jgi:hypothetical protein
MWLHIQRMKYRRRELDQDHETQLNAILPTWRIGRVRGRPPGTPNIQPETATSIAPRAADPPIAEW